MDRVAWRRAGDGQRTAAQLLFVLTACGRRADCKKADGFEATGEEEESGSSSTAGLTEPSAAAITKK